MIQLPLYISKRYLFSKKSTSAINIITGIATLGIAVGTAALIMILCVFNGFEDLVTEMMGNFNPDVKILPAKGKTFTIDTSKLIALKNINGVAETAISLEEVAFFEYAGSQDFGIIKGVDKNYSDVVAMDSVMQEGRFLTEAKDNYYAVVGAGLRNKLAINVENPLEPLVIYMAKSDALSGKPFKEQLALPIGTFGVQQDFDNQYILSSIALVQDLLNQYDQASAIEIKLKDKNNKEAVASIRQLMGNDFIIKDRFQQNEAFLKIMNVEKWMSFAIVSLMIILIAFNMIGSLWMIVLDKKKDISILKAMGMNDFQVRNIFLGTGFWLVIIGLIAGFVLAIILYLIHKNIGLVSVPEGFMMESYPASMRWHDFITVGITVLVIGLLASIPASRKAMSIPALVRD